METAATIRWVKRLVTLMIPVRYRVNMTPNVVMVATTAWMTMPLSHRSRRRRVVPIADAAEH